MDFMQFCRCIERLPVVGYAWTAWWCMHSWCLCPLRLFYSCVGLCLCSTFVCRVDCAFLRLQDFIVNNASCAVCTRVHTRTHTRTRAVSDMWQEICCEQSFIGHLGWLWQFVLFCFSASEAFCNNVVTCWTDGSRSVVTWSVSALQRLHR